VIVSTSLLNLRIGPGLPDLACARHRQFVELGHPRGTEGARSVRLGMNVSGSDAGSSGGCAGCHGPGIRGLLRDRAHHDIAIGCRLRGRRRRFRHGGAIAPAPRARHSADALQATALRRCGRACASSLAGTFRQSLIIGTERGGEIGQTISGAAFDAGVEAGIAGAGGADMPRAAICACSMPVATTRRESIRRGPREGRADDDVGGPDRPLRESWSRLRRLRTASGPCRR